MFVFSCNSDKKDILSLNTFPENSSESFLLSTNDNLYIKKILLDHIRACCHLINDNVIPDREGRGYVLRRILRRSSRFVYKNNIKDPFLYQCAEVICTSSKDYPELKKNYIDTGLAKIEFRHFPLDVAAFNAAKIAQCNNELKKLVLITQKQID